MSFIPEGFKKEMDDSLDKIKIFQQILSEEELKEKKEKYIEFLKENYNNEKIWNDGLAEWVYIKSPEKDDKNKPREIESDFSDDNNLWICKFKLGQISVFGTQEQMEEIGWDNGVVIRGLFRKQYKLIGSNEYKKSLKALSKEYLKPVEEMIKNDDYFESYSINIFQVIE